MLRKLTLALLGPVILITGALAFTGRKPSVRPSPQHQAQQKDTPIPEHVAYHFLFRRMVTYKKMAVEKGHPQARDRALQREAGLTDDQYGKLDEIAAATVHEVDQQDARAREIIAAVRSRYPGGVIPRGEKLPAPPPSC